MTIHEGIVEHYHLGADKVFFRVSRVKDGYMLVSIWNKSAEPIEIQIGGEVKEEINPNASISYCGCGIVKPNLGFFKDFQVVELGEI